MDTEDFRKKDRERKTGSRMSHSKSNEALVSDSSPEKPIRSVKEGKKKNTDKDHRQDKSLKAESKNQTDEIDLSKQLPYKRKVLERPKEDSSHKIARYDSFEKKKLPISTIEEAKIELPKRSITEDSEIMMTNNPIILESVASFTDMVLESSKFVDKTKFIQEIIRVNSGSIIITRPRRWGKSINLDMLRTFFQPQIDENGIKHFKDGIDNSKLFKGGKVTVAGEPKFLQKLAISNEIEFKYQGEFPVLFLKFNSISGHSGEDSISYITGRIRSTCRDAYNSHPYLYKKLLVKEIRNILNIKVDYHHTDIDDLSDMIEARGGAISKALSVYQGYLYKDPNSDLRNFLKELINNIYKYFKKKIYVLIDEYDAPLNSSIGKPYYSYVEGLMKDIYSGALKDNIKVKKTVMIGILPLSTQSLFSGANNFTTYTVNDIIFTSSFGFTEKEVSSLMNAVFQDNQGKIESEKKKIKTWYNRYNIGNHTVYNPWSICRCLSAYISNHPNPLQAYWASSGSTELILYCFNKLPNKKKFDKLICTGTLNYAIDNNLTFGDAINEEQFFSLLLHAGYLTRTVANCYTLPNYEVQHSFFKDISAIWMKNSLGLDPEIALGFTKKLAKHLSNSQEYIELLSKYLNCFQALIKSETDMQVFIGGSTMIACLDKVSHHRAYAEYRTTTGNIIDHIFIPIDKISNTIIIHEYTRIIDGNLTEAVIKEQLESACWQIYAQDYLSAAYDLYLKYEGCVHWTVMSTRSILLYKSCKDDEWKLRCAWFDHDIKQVKTLTDFFSQTKKKIINPELLKIHGAASKSKRQAFLGHMQGDRCRSIFDLLSPLSIKNGFTEISETEKSNFSELQRVKSLKNH